MMVENLHEIRQVVKNSFQVLQFEPQDKQVWDDAYESFLKLKQPL